MAAGNSIARVYTWQQIFKNHLEAAVRCFCLLILPGIHLCKTFNCINSAAGVQVKAKPADTRSLDKQQSGQDP